MKRSYKVAATVSAALGLGLAAAAFAHPGGMGDANSTGMGQGMGRGMAMHGNTTGQGQAAVQQIMTPEERTALMEKMRNAKTPEERQQIAAATRAEMEKRAKDKGITLPEQRGPQGRMGAGATPGTQGHSH